MLKLLQEGDDPIPLDLRDYVDSYKEPEDIDAHIADLAPRITERLQEVTQAEFPVGLFPGAHSASCFHPESSQHDF